MSRSRYLAAAERDVTEAEKRNHADFYDFCPMIFTFSDHCLFVILGASHAHNTRQLLGSQSFTVSRGPTSGRIVLFVQRCAALLPGRAQGPRLPGPAASHTPPCALEAFLLGLGLGLGRGRGLGLGLRFAVRVRARARVSG